MKDRLASPESIPVHLNRIALRKAKIAYNFGLSECNIVKWAVPLEKAMRRKNSLLGLSEPEKC